MCLLLRYAILRSLYHNNKSFMIILKRPILLLSERYMVFRLDFGEGFSNDEGIPIYSHIYV